MLHMIGPRNQPASSLSEGQARYIERMSKEDFLADKRKQAVIPNLVIIGEAATLVGS